MSTCCWKAALSKDMDTEPEPEAEAEALAAEAAVGFGLVCPLIANGEILGNEVLAVTPMGALPCCIDVFRSAAPAAPDGKTA